MLSFTHLQHQVTAKQSPLDNSGHFPVLFTNLLSKSATDFTKLNKNYTHVHKIKLILQGSVKMIKITQIILVSSYIFP